MGNSRDGLIRATAGDVLREGGVSEPPVPIERLVPRYGLALAKGDLRPGSGYFDAGAWAVRLSPDLFEETPENANRRRFTLAHELGHCVLEHGESSCWNLAAVAESADIGEIDDLPDFEAEAHKFARELLLPRPWLQERWEAKPNLSHVAREFVVSEATLVIVLMERRLLMKSRKQRR